MIAKDWVDAFNAHDLPRILAHYREDVELVSPVYLKVTDGKSAVCRGKPALEAYFSRGLSAYPDLRFSIINVFPGINSVCVYYHTSVGNRSACECMEFDSEGLIIRVLAHYALVE